MPSFSYNFTEELLAFSGTCIRGLRGGAATRWARRIRTIIFIYGVLGPLVGATPLARESSRRHQSTVDGSTLHRSKPGEGQAAPVESGHGEVPDIRFLCPGTPGTPMSVMAMAASPSQIAVSWSSLPATGRCQVFYKVFRGTHSGFSPSLVNEVAVARRAPSYLDAGLNPSTTFYYVIESYYHSALTYSPVSSTASSEGSATTTRARSSSESSENDAANGIFSDLSAAYDGGVANPADGSTGNVLQQTLLAAYFWSRAHGGAHAIAVAASGYPVSGSRIVIPGNVDLICSSYAEYTYTGGCPLYQTDPGNNTATGGSPLLIADYTAGIMPDNTTTCSTEDNPKCIAIASGGLSILGFTLYGGGGAAGGRDVGIRILANSVHVQDTAIYGFFGGPGIQELGGVNNSIDWNYGTNVNAWWCANPTQFTEANLQAAYGVTDGNIGGIDLPVGIDGEQGSNQYSTGCAFSSHFAVSAQYPHMASMHVNGAGNLIQSNLLQADSIGLIVRGAEQRVMNNRSEYQGREAIQSTAIHSIFSGNVITSACLDPNLAYLRPGAPNNGIPPYPSTPTKLRTGNVLIDSNGNAEQVVYANQEADYGFTDLYPPAWPSLGETVNGSELIWGNVGSWEPGLTSETDPGPALPLTNGLCFAVNDQGNDNAWTANQVGEEVGVNGPSYSRGSYLIPGPGGLSANTCAQDHPDAYGNGQCWWGGDLFSNGGPPGLAPNGMITTSSGGGTAWVGDYSIDAFTDAAPHHYNNFQGMSNGGIFSVTSSTAANIIDTWSVQGSGGSFYGHPSVLTCGGTSLTVMPGQYYEFIYNLQSQWAVTQINCPAALSGGGATTGASLPDFTLTPAPSSLTLSPGSQGSINITLTPSGNLNGNIALKCTGLPANFGCTFSEASLVANGSGTVMSSVLVISTGKSIAPAKIQRLADTGHMAGLALIPGALFTILSSFMRRLSGQKRQQRRRLFLIISTMLLLIVTGCGLHVNSGSASGSTTSTSSTAAPSLYSVTVTATAQGGLTHTIVIQLLVT